MLISFSHGYSAIFELVRVFCCLANISTTATYRAYLQFRRFCVNVKLTVVIIWSLKIVVSEFLIMPRTYAWSWIFKVLKNKCVNRTGLKAPERINYKLAVLVYKCQHGSAPPYLADELCRPADIEGRRRLRSASSPVVISRGNAWERLSLIHIWRCRRIERCRSRWSPYH